MAGARGGQAHLWGSKHATRWAWAHCNDFTGPDGRARDETFIDGVSVFVPRFGREIGPNTPVVARIGGQDLLSIGPLAVTRNPSEFDLDHWRFEARDGRRKLTGEVTARREDLVGVTYHDPDGELAYCYNTEVADMRLEVCERDGRRGPWRKVDELRSDAPRALRVRAARARRGRAAASVTAVDASRSSGARGRPQVAGVLRCRMRGPPSARARGASARGPTSRSTSGILTDDDPARVARNRELLAGGARARSRRASRWAGRCTAPTCRSTTSRPARAVGIRLARRRPRPGRRPGDRLART